MAPEIVKGTANLRALHTMLTTGQRLEDSEGFGKGQEVCWKFA